MNHPLKEILKLYEKNRVSLANALTKAGGSAQAILQQDEYIDIMTTLASNNITIEATYQKDITK